MLNLSLDKQFAAICLGRAGMDLYANELNTDFNQVTQFNKHVGGSPANIAVGMAKLGASVGFIGKVSDDVVGRYVNDYLSSQGVDIAGMQVDSTGTRTSLAITEMKPDNCAVVIYRNNAADLALAAEDINADYIAKSRMLVVSGTALSAEPSRSATLKAIEYAVASDTLVVLDLDYRAYTWQSEQEAAQVYQHAAKHAHLLIGNNEEYEVMGVAANSQISDTAKACLRDNTQCILIKAGSAGSYAFTRDGDHFAQGVFSVNSLKPFGAGDAYAAAICTGLSQGLSLRDCVARGSAAAAIVVSGTSCSEASPTSAQLELFMNENVATDLAAIKG